MTLKRSSVSLENRGSKKRKSREHECKLCSSGTLISTSRHAVQHHLPWFVVPDTACWTCKKQYGSSGKLKKHADEERIKSDLDPHVYQEPHQMFGQEHVMEWCELGYGFVQQVAAQTANGSLEGLLDWVMVCVTNKSEVELHMLDRELLSALGVFFKEPAKEGGDVGTGRMAHGLFNHASAGSRGYFAKHLLEARFCTLQVFCPGDV